MNKSLSASGFTVVELSAILGVITLSAAILTPGFSGATSSNANGTIETVSGSSVVFAEPETLPVEVILVNITNTTTGQTVSRTVDDPDATSTTFTGLDPQANYTVEVAKKSQAGKSSAAKAFLRYEKTGEKVTKTGIRDVEKEIDVPVLDITKPIAWEMVPVFRITVEELEIEMESRRNPRFEHQLEYRNVTHLQNLNHFLRYEDKYRGGLKKPDLDILESKVQEVLFAFGRYIAETDLSYNRDLLEDEAEDALSRVVKDLFGLDRQDFEVEADIEYWRGWLELDELKIEIEDSFMLGGSEIREMEIEFKFDFESRNYQSLIEMVPDVSKPKAWGTKIEKKKVIETEEYEYEEDEKKSHTREKEIDVDDEKVIIRSSLDNPKRNNSWTTGTIIAVGEDVEKFSVGDVVSYRQGKPFRFDGQKYIEARAHRFLLKKQ